MHALNFVAFLIPYLFWPLHIEPLSINVQLKSLLIFPTNYLSSGRHQACSVIPDEETCDGEAFLTCVTNNSKDIAELANFIECKQEKDYASWLVYKKKFRSTRLKKIAKQRRMRMTKVCRSLGYQGRVKL